jgi:preprotein translocase subunit Sss1
MATAETEQKKNVWKEVLKWGFIGLLAVGVIGAII